MNAKQFQKWLIRKGACVAGREWAEGKSMHETWDALERPDWMLWLYERRRPSDKIYRLVACYSARLVIDIYEKQYPNDKRPRMAIESAERYAKNRTEKNRKEMTAARCAAGAAAGGAAGAVAGAAAWAAARAVAWASARYAAGAAVGVAWATAKVVTGVAASGAINKKICDYMRTLVKKI